MLGQGKESKTVWKKNREGNTDREQRKRNNEQRDDWKCIKEILVCGTLSYLCTYLCILYLNNIYII